MIIPAHDPFDPLVELYGLWTTELADTFLPIPGMAPARYECLNGKLIMSPRRHSAVEFAATTLSTLLHEPATQADYRVESGLTVRFSPQHWIEPDITVLTESAYDRNWIAGEQVCMPVQFVLPPCGRGRIDKLALCAEYRIPHFLRVELFPEQRTAEVVLLELNNGHYRTIVRARSHQGFRSAVPFPMSFDPTDLLLGQAEDAH